MPALPAPPAPPARTSRSATPRGLCAPALRQWGWDCRPEQAVPIPAPRKALCCVLLHHQQRVPSLLVGGQPGGLLLLSAGLGDLNQQGLPARVQEEPDQRALDSSQVEQRHRLPSPASGLARSSPPICPGSERGGNLLQGTQPTESEVRVLWPP